MASVTTIVGRGASVVVVVDDVDLVDDVVDELVVEPNVVELDSTVVVVELSSTVGSAPPHAARITIEPRIIARVFM
ncbi:MAG: hypothetical protein KJO36_00345 [Acidimicrobiia bacterium]|nr:hypothetical protein [Acidimicrobiia bacterium]NND14311.1 hypothetical protein [Acidimicrobiia bacterium]